MEVVSFFPVKESKKINFCLSRSSVTCSGEGAVWRAKIDDFPWLLFKRVRIEIFSRPYYPPLHRSPRPSWLRVVSCSSFTILSRSLGQELLGSSPRRSLGGLKP